MKHHNAPRPWALATLLLAPFVPLFAADEDPVLRVKLEQPQRENKNRFGMSYRMGFNVTAEFKNVGNVARGAAGRGPGPATGGGIDRFYDDGYNRVDTSGNRDGLTWFWAYRNQDQIVEDTVVMHSSSVTPINSKTIDSDPQHGAELTYNRELGRNEQGTVLWGVEGGLGWMDINIRDHRGLFGGTRDISDAYDLGGVDPSRNLIPPGQNTPPPYTEGEGQQFNPGTFQGPGPLIDDSPTRTVMRSASGASVFGSRRLEGDLWTLRLGPYLDFPLDEKWTFSLSGGAVVGVLDAEYRFNQVVSTGGPGSFQSGAGSRSEVLYGGFASATIHYAINDQWGAFVGGQYLGLTGYSAKANGQKVELDLGRTAFFTAGVTFSF